MSVPQTPATIAQDQLNVLVKQLADCTPEVRVQVAQLAALIEIGDRLDGIEKSLDLGLRVRTE